MSHICVTCGVQFAPTGTDEPPPECPICLDERQFVGRRGQRWTTPDELRSTHTPVIADDFGLTGIGITPHFAIGQRALLIPTAAGHVLWDCTPLLDDAVAGEIDKRGGLAAIAISHPHFYASMVDWAERFDCPIHLHAADRAWVMRPDPRIVHWDGETLALAPDATLIRLGGHFDGATVLHHAHGDGALMTGDVVSVAADRRWVTFMRSYPNYIPLPASEIRRIETALEPYAFDRIHGGWFGSVVARDAKAALRRSAQRYVRAVGGVDR